MNITFPTNTKEVIDTIRGVIGEDVLINIYGIPTTCSACFLDPTTNLSADPLCPVCSGFYYIVALEPESISGHVRWHPYDEAIYTPGGIVNEGDCVVTIPYDLETLEKVKAAESFTVGGFRLLLYKYVLRGKPINRIRLILKEG